MDTANVEEWLKHRDWVARLARSLVSDASTADDLAQETWLVVARRPGRGPARPWFSRVLRNLAAQRHRAESSRREREERVARGEAVASASDLAAKVEIQRLLAEAVLRLQEPFRETVVLRYFETLSSADIARRLGSPESTVRWRLMRALEMLREDLDARHEGSRERWMAVVAGGVLVTRSSWKASAGWLLLLALGSIGVGLGFGVLRGTEPPPARLDAATTRLEDLVREADRAIDGVPEGAEPRSSIASPPPADAGRILVGRLLDPSGRALTGARAHATNWGPSSRASTDDAGGFRLEIQPSQDPPIQDDPDWVELQLRASGRESRNLGLRAPRARTTHLGDLVLRAGASIRGSVVDATGAPLPSLTAYVEDLTPVVRSRLSEGDPAAASVLPFTRLEHAARTSTRPDGSFLFEGLPPGPVRLWALDPHALAAFSEVIWVDEGESVVCPDLVVRRPDPSIVVRGVVLGADGTPVDGAAIEVGWHPGGTARADEAGRFTAILLAPKPGMIESIPHTLKVSDPRKRWRDATVPRVAAGQGEVRVVMQDWPRLALRVRDPEGRPLERCGANVTVNGSDLESYPLSDRPGGELVVRVPSVAFGILAYAPGYALRRLEHLDPDELPQSLDCTLELRPGVSGTVLVDGRPVAGARVSMTPMLSEGSCRIIAGVDAAPRPMLSRVLGLHPLEDARTDEQGRFHVGLLSGRPALLRVEREGSAPWLRWSVTDAIDDLEVTLTAGGSVHGRVAVPDGTDPSGILVGATCGDERVLATRTDAQGGYRIDGLAPGSWQVRLLAREQTPEELRGTKMDWGVPGMDLRADCEVVEGRVCRFDFERETFERPRLFGSLTVDGAPAVGWLARLFVDGDLSPRASATVSSQGRFEFTVGTPGRYRLVVDCAEQADRPLSVHDVIELAPGERSWSFDLVTGTLSGRKRTALVRHDSFLCAVRSGPGSTVCVALLDTDRDLVWGPTTVPAGAVSIAEVDMERYLASDSGPVLLRVQVPPAGTIEVTVP